MSERQHEGNERQGRFGVSPDVTPSAGRTPPPGGRHGGFGGGPMGGPRGLIPGAKAKNFKATMKNLLLHLKPYWVGISAVVIFAVASCVFSIAGPKIMGQATTALYRGVTLKLSGAGGIDFSYLGSVCMTLLALYATSMAFSGVQTFIMSGITQKVSYNFRKEIFEKINRLPLKYFDRQTRGEVLSRMTNDIDTVSQTLNQSMSQIITSVASVVGILIMMLTISPLMTLIALMIIPISLFLVSVIVKFSQPQFKKQQEYLGHVNGQVEEIYSGHIVMKAFSGERKALENFSADNRQLYNSAWKAQFLSGVMMPLMGFVGNLGYVGMCIAGGILAARNAIQVGDILSFITYVRSFTQPITQTAQIANVLQSTAAAAERVFEFLNEEEESADPRDYADTGNIQGRVAFEHVRFGYDEDKIIIHDFTADVLPGRRIAIVGPTGAGKTTIVKLLMRFYDLNGGKISVDGSDITEFSRDGLRGLFGMVLQDTWLFSGTIMENIRYGRPGATDEEVINAAKSAHVHRFIRTLPDGYNMMLNEDTSNVSQGEKQLLTIARAFLCDPRILILDEATSSVDTRTEVRIQEAMQSLMQGRTSFIIAHRLSTIRNADLILVMDQGDIVEQGTHEQLLSSKGFYYQLYNSQFESAV